MEGKFEDSESSGDRIYSEDGVQIVRRGRGGQLTEEASDDARPSRRMPLWEKSGQRRSVNTTDSSAVAPSRPVTEGVGTTRGPKAAASATGYVTTGADAGTEKNHDMCDACGDGGDLLCCDNCPNAFHFECVFPPIDPNNLPEGDWFCNTCVHKLGHYKKPKNQKERQGPMKKIFELVAPINPKVFTLPATLKRSINAQTYRRNEIKNLDMMSMLRYPDSSVQRYTPEEKDLGRKSRVYKTCSVCGDDHDDLVKCHQCKKHYHRFCVEPMAIAVGAKWCCPEHDGHIAFNLKQARQDQQEADDEGIYEPEAIRLDFSEKSLPSFCRGDDSEDESSSSDRRQAAPSSRRGSAAAPAPTYSTGPLIPTAASPAPVTPSFNERDKRLRDRNEREKLPVQPQHQSRRQQQEKQEGSASTPNEEHRTLFKWADAIHTETNKTLSKQYDQVLRFVEAQGPTERRAILKQMLEEEEKELLHENTLNQPIVQLPPKVAQKTPLVQRDQSPLSDFVMGLLSGPVGDRNPYYAFISPQSKRNTSVEIQFPSVEHPLTSLTDFLDANPELRDFLAHQRLVQIIHHVGYDVQLQQLTPSAHSVLLNRVSNGIFQLPFRPPKRIVNLSIPPVPVKSTPPGPASMPPPQARPNSLPLSPVTIVAHTLDTVPSSLASAPPLPAPSGSVSPASHTVTTTKRTAPDTPSSVERPAKRTKMNEPASPVPGTQTPQSPASTPTAAPNPPVSPASPSAPSSTVVSSKPVAAVPHLPEPITNPAKSLLRAPGTHAAAVVAAPASAPAPKPQPEAPVDELSLIISPHVPTERRQPIVREFNSSVHSGKWPTRAVKHQIGPARKGMDPRLGKMRFLHFTEKGQPVAAVLTWRNADEKPKKFELAIIDDDPTVAPCIRIGRANADVEIDITKYTETKTASHEHAEIRYDRALAQWFLFNYGRNGSRVNQLVYGKSGEHPLKPGQLLLTHVKLFDLDEIEIGHVAFTLHALNQRSPRPTRESEDRLVQYQQQRTTTAAQPNK